MTSKDNKPNSGYAGAIFNDRGEVLGPEQTPTWKLTPDETPEQALDRLKKMIAFSGKLLYSYNEIDRARKAFESAATLHGAMMRDTKLWSNHALYTDLTLLIDQGKYKELGFFGIAATSLAPYIDQPKSEAKTQEHFDPKAAYERLRAEIKAVVFIAKNRFGLGNHHNQEFKGDVGEVMKKATLRLRAISLEIKRLLDDPSIAAQTQSLLGKAVITPKSNDQELMVAINILQGMYYSQVPKYEKMPASSPDQDGPSGNG